MDSVSRGELPDALDLSFHPAEFDVFIQARQASYKSNADPTTGLTPSTANCPKIKQATRLRDNHMALILTASLPTEQCFSTTVVLPKSWETAHQQNRIRRK
jgi:hypothetical protein